MDYSVKNDLRNLTLLIGPIDLIDLFGRIDLIDLIDSADSEFLNVLIDLCGLLNFRDLINLIAFA